MIIHFVIKIETYHNKIKTSSSSKLRKGNLHCSFITDHQCNT